jgi:serine/threonine protein kinase
VTASVACIERALSTKILSEMDVLAMPSIGKGGQGVVRRSSEDLVCKIWHDSGATPAGSAYEQKLKKLPIWVDDQLALPTAFIRIPERGGDLSGFEMPFLGERNSFGNLRNVGWKKRNQTTQADVAKYFVALYDLLWELQQMGVVVGDLKFQNVLIMSDGSVSIIDVDSLGVEGDPCTAYSREYVDPRLCDPKGNLEQLIKPHDAESVWYSYMVMLFEALSGAHPFTEGTHRPPGGEAGVSAEHRVMKGLSVFHPDVRLNNKFQDAISAFPDDLKEAFKATFQDGARGRPRRSLITQLIPSQESASQPYKPENRSPWQLFSPRAGANVGADRGVVRIAKVPCREGQALMGKIIDGKLELLTDVDLRKAKRKIAPGSSAASQTNVLKPVDFSGKFTIYQDLNPVIARNLDSRTRRVWIDDGNVLTTAAVGVSPFGGTNIAALLDHTICIPPQSGRVILSKAGGTKMIELPGELSLFSGGTFGLIFSTQGKELTNLFLVSDGVKRILGLPPILGPISDIQCSFSDNFVWVFLTTTPEQSASRYILTLDASGKLRGLGAVSECNRAWHSADVLRSAYDIGSGSKPGLAAVVNGELVRLTCSKFQIVQYCRQRLIENNLPRILLTSENDARGIW